MSTVYKLRNGCEKKVFIVSGDPVQVKAFLLSISYAKF